MRCLEHPCGSAAAAIHQAPGSTDGDADSVSVCFMNVWEGWGWGRQGVPGGGVGRGQQPGVSAARGGGVSALPGAHHVGQLRLPAIKDLAIHLMPRTGKLACSRTQGPCRARGGGCEPMAAVHKVSWRKDAKSVFMLSGHLCST